MTTDNKEKRIALALSGGGARAAVFHAGVLLEMAQRGELEQVVHISSVSGGSIFMALVFHFAGACWPSSAKYIKTIYPEIKHRFTNYSLQGIATRNIFTRPGHLRYLVSRVNALAFALRYEWGIEERLCDLPEAPVWTINGTTAENGRRFQFRGEWMGDSDYGYAHAPRFWLAEAVAVSAAYPGLVGPLTVDTTKSMWEKNGERFSLPFKRLHLFDGGVYDNLGLEAVFDVSSRTFREPGAPDFIVVSDAGAPLGDKAIPRFVCPSSLARMANIMSNQARSLSVRSLFSFLNDNPDSGRYVWLESRPGPEQVENRLNAETEVYFAKHYATDLAKMSESAFDRLSKRGQNVARERFSLGASPEDLKRFVEEWDAPAKRS